MTYRLLSLPERSDKLKSHPVMSEYHRKLLQYIETKMVAGRTQRTNDDG